MTVPTPPQEILIRYCSSPSVAKVTVLGQGNINDTFLVRTEKQVFVLQRINDQVFPSPQLLIDNLQQLTRHLASRPDTARQRWEEAVLVPALDGSLSVLDSRGSMWRALSYIKDSITVSRVDSPLLAEQCGWALGHFHKRLIGLDVQKMHLPLPGFHQLTGYLRHYDQLTTHDLPQHSTDIRFCLEAIRNKRESALSLERMLARGDIQQRIIHGDPKVANVLFDRDSHLAVCLIDLDTVGPGLLHHDLGDCLRSACNTAGEDSDQTQIKFDLDLCRIVLKGYFQEADKLLTPIDRRLLYDGLKAITFELGLRFFADYLQGGIYFKCQTPEETLHRAVVQFSLLQDIVKRKNAFLAIIPLGAV
ncbi:MAG: aminoglycoside phosphotransferase family protein [Proteobacteria bacterium]|nr:aminoglycoside phosphotransferase family protein [Pseudomonadota bacterium]MBU1138760.1 aminoglycoside phosphotransferase family protein [Pseudomonadota bacterium]